MIARGERRHICYLNHHCINTRYTDTHKYKPVFYTLAVVFLNGIHFGSQSYPFLENQFQLFSPGVSIADLVHGLHHLPQLYALLNDVGVLQSLLVTLQRIHCEEICGGQLQGATST